MRIFITDTGMVPMRPTKSDVIVRDDGNIGVCTGCCACWYKTPGVCVKQDRLQHLGGLLSKCDELVIVSRCIMGSVSPFVKCVMERMVSYLGPECIKKNGSYKRKLRYDNIKMKLTVYFYGEDVTEEEKDCARELIYANAMTLGARPGQVIFLRDAAEIGGF